MGLIRHAQDCSVSETVIVYCRHLKNGHLTDVIVGLEVEDLERVHTDGVFKAVSRSMERFVGPGLLDKLVAVRCDGASVNLGVRNSVATRLKADREYILPIHCVCHRMELGQSGKRCCEGSTKYILKQLRDFRNRSYQSPAHIIKIPARGALHIIHGRVVREDPRAVFRGLTVIFYNENAKYDYGHVCDLEMERIRSRLEDPNNNTVPVTQVAHFVDTRE
ncbi:hypothetical protein LSH36_288g00000 [Paralvinella palmiformis]|uniref:DUF4371 domain-containing protein n=1 Tax=Paralvinella palmiformis TaxID=53620 RepID=A0AAD9JJ86_9ANNE|nr:hypothetical protein LSH36_288g00000 [Paralvinella palmiformis]